MLLGVAVTASWAGCDEVMRVPSGDGSENEGAWQRGQSS